MSFLSQA